MGRASDGTLPLQKIVIGGYKLVTKISSSVIKKLLKCGFLGGIVFNLIHAMLLLRRLPA
jgi:hypothetical protein